MDKHTCTCIHIQSICMHALKVELIRVLPLVMYELDSNEAISFLNELVK